MTIKVTAAVVNQAFEKAELAKYSPKEQHDYEQSLKTYRDLKGVIDTAFDDGKAEGKAEGILEIAKNLKDIGVSVEIIAKTTGLSEEEIAEL
jgi:predicted transposase/invertase (TIGR01784 family)